MDILVCPVCQNWKKEKSHRKFRICPQCLILQGKPCGVWFSRSSEVVMASLHLVKTNIWGDGWYLTLSDFLSAVQISLQFAFGSLPSALSGSGTRLRQHTSPQLISSHCEDTHYETRGQTQHTVAIKVSMISLHVLPLTLLGKVGMITDGWSRDLMDKQSWCCILRTNKSMKQTF